MSEEITSCRRGGKGKELEASGGRTERSPTGAGSKNLKGLMSMYGRKWTGLREKRKTKGTHHLGDLFA